jgi:hypothetical protein
MDATEVSGELRRGRKVEGGGGGEEGEGNEVLT